jgi:tetratricopeptide (TPR) repeat protein
VFAYASRGLVYYNKKDYACARADYEKALRYDPNYANARNNLEALRRQGYQGGKRPPGAGRSGGYAGGKGSIFRRRQNGG